MLICKRYFPRKNLSTGNWYYNEKNGSVVRLIKIRGKFIHNMGYSSKDEKEVDSNTKYDYLYPEEALYLTEHVNKMSTNF